MSTTPASAQQSSAVDCISPAIDRTKRLMSTRPFRWARWWRLGLLGLATGEISSSGGCSFNNFGDLSKLGHPQQQQHFSPPAMTPQQVWQIVWHSTGAPLIALLVVLVVMLVLVHLFISSVLRFALVDAVLRDRYMLLEAWKRWQAKGTQYFLFQLLMLAVGLGFWTVMGGIGYLLWRATAGFTANAGPAIVAIVILAPFVLVFIVALAVFMLFAKDFAVPVLLLENVTMEEALRRVWEQVKVAKSDFAIYVLMKIVIGIALAVMMAILLAMVLVLPLIIGVALLVIGVIALGKTTLAALGFGVAAGFVLICFVMALIALVGAPVGVFWQYFVLEFFAARYPHLQAVLNPPPPFIEQPFPPPAPPANPLPA